MVYELRTYKTQVGKVDEFLVLFETVGLPILKKYSTLIGFWYTEIGELNEVVHMWAYRDLNHRRDARAALFADPEWQTEFLPKARPLLFSMATKVLTPANFSPLK